MYEIDALPGRSLQIEGEEWLYFSGTAYLGIVQDPYFQQLVAEGLRRYGTHYGGSRLASIRLGLFEEAEAVLTRITGAPAALVVSSGTVAGHLAVRQLSSPDTHLFAAPGLHPAIWPHGYEPTSGSFEAWSRQVTSKLNRHSREGKTHSKPLTALILSDALDSLHAQAYDFSWLSEIPTEVSIRLLLDDSHGLGITGPEGGGIYAKLSVPENVELTVVSSLGKAFGIPGGVILGSTKRLAQLQQSPHFGGASPVSPAFLHAFIEGQPLYRKSLRRLRRNVRLFKQALPTTDLFQHFDEYPVFYSPDPELASFLEKHRILISSFPYPTPEDELITRIVINSLHEQEDVELLAQKIGEKF